MFYINEIKNRPKLTTHEKINFRANGYYYVGFLKLRQQLMLHVNCHKLLRPYEAYLLEAQHNHIQKQGKYFGKTRYEYENNI